METVNALAEEYGKPVIMAARAHLRARMEGEKAGLNKGVKVHKPFLFYDYLQLQMNTKAAISDNEMVMEESGVLGFPTVFVGNAMKSPEAHEQDSLVATELDWPAVRNALQVLAQREKGQPRGVELAGTEGVPKVSEQVVKIIVEHVEAVKGPGIERGTDQVPQELARHGLDPDDDATLPAEGTALDSTVHAT